MKRLLMSALAVAAIASSSAPAAAQSWTSINQRQATLDHRIDQGIQNGSLNRVEAAKLRAEFRQLVVLEATYRRSGGGLSLAERNDLDRRMNALAARIRMHRSDGAWIAINQRQATLDHRIDQGIQNGSLNRVEAAKLRAEFRQLVVLEATYRRSGGGLSLAERNDLDRRMNALAARIRMHRSDGAWITINQRQAQLEQRINNGIRAGTLTRNEAVKLRAEFRGIAVLEANYRRSGGAFTLQEKADLDRRMNVLSAKIRLERLDHQRH